MTKIARRTFLRGFGTALALPWLDAMSFAGAAAPRRLAFVFIPNGVHYPDWEPRTEDGKEYLSHLLDPLVAQRADFSIISGLTHNNARALGDGPGDHARSAACFLTGAHPFKTAGSNITAGVSVDQVAAKHVGGDTRFRSLELGCEPGLRSGNCDSGYSCSYSSNISWRTPHLPMAKEVNPRLVFERLFMIGGAKESVEARAQRLAARKSILDYVRADGARLSRKLGKADRRKLDEYFTGVRELEQRIEMVEKSAKVARDAGMVRPTGIPRSYREHLRLMSDLIVLAFRLDLTRVVSFMMANEGSNRSFPELGISHAHHHITHHGGDAQKIAMVRKINRFQSEEFGYLLKRLKETPDGGGSLLDSSMVVYGSAISDGNRHDHRNLPILLGGGGGGTLKPGRHIVAPRETPLCNLYVSLLQRMGAPAKRFGDSTGSLL